MKLRVNQGWAAVALLAGMLLMPGAVRAQDDAASETAFAGGQTVRGTVASVGPDRLEVKSETGTVYAIIVTSNTRMMKARQPVKLAEIKPGDGIGAMGVLDAPNRTVHAAVVFVIDAEQVRRAEADLGKTYITGRVASIDELKLTIRRPDGVNQVIRVDEDTSFRRGRRGMAGAMGGGAGGSGGDAPPAAGRPSGGGASGTAERTGGESITLADIKVGDTVFGRGGLKDGVFVPTELGVLDPAARGRRRGGATDGSVGVAPGAQQGAGAGANSPGTGSAR